MNSNISIAFSKYYFKVFDFFTKGINAMETTLNFEKHEKLGYLTFCPTNIGTALRASVHVKLPRLADCELILDTCKRLSLQPRGLYGESTDAGEDGVYDISNKHKIGQTEWDLINSMW